MFDYKSIVSDDQLTVDFVASKFDDEGYVLEYVAKERSSDLEVGVVTIEGSTFSASNDDIFMQYKLWQTRPERAVGKKIEIKDRNLEQLIEDYEELFIGSYIQVNKTHVSPKGSCPYEGALDWLRSTDFYKCPASTKYHDSFVGGLLVHSLKVYNKMIDLLKVEDFKSVDVAEATLVSLVHDWCKIGLYESYKRNVKDDKTGKWHEEPAFKHNQKGVPFGHGVSSMYLASRVSKLSVEQSLAIRWHMGRWDVSDVQQNELQLANKTYPIVYLIQFADQLACTDYGQLSI